MKPRGYDALREDAAWFELSHRGLIEAAGEDRARLLHAMTTNHVEQMQPGDLCYAFFLNAQGRILADAHLLCLENSFWIDTEPERGEFLLGHLDRFIIADDVALADLTGTRAVFAVEGAKAADVLTGIGVAMPPGPGKWISWRNWLLAAATVTGSTGFRIYAPSEDRQAIRQVLRDAGVAEAEPEAVEAIRIENAQPRYGDDISDAHIPHETRLLKALHFSKGCYLGQEIVERVRSRGHVNRVLAQMLIDLVQPPAKGEKVIAGGTEIGEITSAAWSPALEKVVALGYVRAERLASNAALEIAGHPARFGAAAPG
jgi:folate-binding protein YgfZ